MGVCVYGRQKGGVDIMHHKIYLSRQARCGHTHISMGELLLARHLCETPSCKSHAWQHTTTWEMVTLSSESCLILSSLVSAKYIRCQLFISTWKTYIVVYSTLAQFPFFFDVVCTQVHCLPINKYENNVFKNCQNIAVDVIRLYPCIKCGEC